MRALRITADSNPPSAQLTDMPFEQLSAGDTVIQVCYSSLNYKDALAVTGADKIARQLPLNAGIDAAGRILESQDPRFTPGDKVLVTGWHLSETRDGGLADYIRLPGEHVTALPEGLSLWEAMALGTAGFTAALALARLKDNYQAAETGPILVSGATGGVGMLAIQMLSQAGFSPIALTRRVDEHGDWLRQLGATQVMHPDELDSGGRPLTHARYGGALDTLGGQALADMLSQIQPGGNVAAIGLAADHKLATTVLPFILRGISLLGVNSVTCPEPRRSQTWQALGLALKPRQLTAIAQHTIALEEVITTCQRMLAGQHQGRTVVAINPE